MGEEEGGREEAVVVVESGLSLVMAESVVGDEVAELEVGEAIGEKGLESSGVAMWESGGGECRVVEECGGVEGAEG